MVRRVYTAHDEAGRSCFAEDGEAPAVFDLADAGLIFHELWRTRGGLASNEGRNDLVAKNLEILPEAGGTALRVVEVAPQSEAVENGRPAHVDMHVTSTTDYNIVLSGQMYAVSDTAEVLLGPGDVVVQRGGRHGWRNPGPRVCVFASIMVNDRPSV